jgi:uncharacterized delta-60 repeat protein
MVSRRQRAGLRAATVGSALAIVAAAALLVAGPAGASPLCGVLDPTFGTGGRAFSALPPTDVPSGFIAVAPQGDGKLVLARESHPEYGRPFTEPGVERRYPDGELDPSFGAVGSVSVPVTGGLGIEAGGRIVFGSTVATKSGSFSGVVRRLDASGAPDPTFGIDGVSAALPFTPVAVAFEPDGDILAAGVISTFERDVITPSYVSVVRLRADGSIDSTFGKKGVTSFVNESPGGTSMVDGLAALPNGGGVLAGNGLVYRLDPSGRLATGFAAGGILKPVDPARALIASPNGELLIAGEHIPGGCCVPITITVRRYGADGAPDPAFGSAGVAAVSLGRGASTVAMMPAPSGGTVILANVETTTRPYGYVPMVADLTATGALDQSFGQSGSSAVAVPPLPSNVKPAPSAAALALTPTGQILVAGTNGDSTLYALNRAGAPEPLFAGSPALQETRFRPSSAAADGVAVDPGGAALVSFQTNAARRVPGGGLLRFEGAGAPEVDSPSGYLPSVRAGQITRRGGRNCSLSSGSQGRFVVCFGADGGPIAEFGEDGRSRLPSAFHPRALVLSANAAITVVGRFAGRRGMAALRLTGRGRPDRGFGRRGVAFVPSRGLFAVGLSATVAADGDVVLGGALGHTAAVVRLLPEGRVDRAFGHAGTLAGFLGKKTEAVAITAVRGGAFLVATHRRRRGWRAPTVVRITARGSVDRSYERDGHLSLRRAGIPLGFVRVGGKTVLLATARGGGGAALFGFDGRGAVDRRFGHQGTMSAATGQQLPFHPVQAAVDSRGRIVVAGTAGNYARPPSRVELLRIR